MSEIRALYQEAFDHFAEQEYDLSIAAYRRVNEADPTFVLAYQGLAEAHGRKGELPAAIAAIQKAIELDPDEALYHTSLSRFLQQQGKIPEAEEAMAKGMEAQTRGGKG